MKKDYFIQTRAHCILIFCQSLVTIHLVPLLHERRISCERSLSDMCALCGLNVIPHWL